MNKAQELRNLSEESKRNYREEIKKNAIDNLYEELINHITKCAWNEHSKCKLSYIEEKYFKLDKECVRKEIVFRLMGDGFCINRVRSNHWMSCDSFLQISWE